MSVLCRRPFFTQFLWFGIAAVTVSGLVGCDSTPSSVSGGSATSSSAPGAGGPPAGPKLTKPSTSLDPLAQPPQIPVPSSGANPPLGANLPSGGANLPAGVNSPAGVNPPSSPLSLPGSGTTASRNPATPGGIPANIPQLPAGGTGLPQTRTDPSSAIAQEIAKAKAALAQTQNLPQTSLPAAPSPAAPSPAASGPSASVDAGSTEGSSSGLTAEAQALSQPVSRNAPPAAPRSSASTALPSISSNRLPSMDFGSSEARGNRPSNARNNSAGRSNPSGLRTAEYVYNPRTGGYGPSN